MAALVVTAPGAAAAPVAGYDHTFTSPRAQTSASRPAADYRYDPTQSVSPSSGGGTFTTTLRTDARAADWSDAAGGSGDLWAAGFLRQVAGETVNGSTFSAATHDNDALVYFQDNTISAAGDSQGLVFGQHFYQGGAYNPTLTNGGYYNDNATDSAPAAGSLVRLAVTINADNTFSETVTVLDANGNPAPATSSTPNPDVLTGTLGGVPTDRYTPFVRYRSGYDTGYNAASPSDNLTFTVSGSDLTGAAPTGALPEAPYVAALPLSAAGVIWVVVRRRQRRHAAS